MVDEERFDLIVIGAGPGGYVAAIRAATGLHVPPRRGVPADCQVQCPTRLEVNLARGKE